MKRRVYLGLLPAFVFCLGLYALRFFSEQAFMTTKESLPLPGKKSFSLSREHSNDGDSVLQLAVLRDSIVPRSPFAQPRPLRPANHSASTAKVVWIRPHIILKGTVGDQAATLVNAKGEKRILRVGQIIDSAEVVSIQPGHVTLRDAHGTFDVTAQE